MDRAKWYITVILTCIFLGVPGYALRAYQEKVIPQGKIIFGMGEEEALNKYGLPDSKSEKLWHYSSPENIYVYVNKSPGVYLYPRFYKGYVGAPMELRVFSGLQDIGDVTSKSNFILSNPDAFNLVGQGVLVPKKAGDYQVIATYKGVYSNASFVSISESEKETETKQEKLVAIDIFPYKPYVNPGTKVYFCAFGTFVFKGSYSVREITRQAEWLSEQNGVTSRLQDSEITLASPGEYKVFCRYKGMQSIPQDMEVARTPTRLEHDLKQVAVVPSSVAISVQNEVPFRSFATYQDNSVEEVTKKTGWVIGDRAILDRESDNVFIAKLVGVTELRGVLEGLRSLPAKIVVSSSPVSKEQAGNTNKQEKSLSGFLSDIKGDINDFKDKAVREDKFKYIRIAPDYCDMRVGDQKQLSAFGVKDDNAEEDITILAEWKSSDDALATVKSGLVAGISIGELKICVQYKNIENQCVPAVVRAPELTSIAVSPQHLKIDTSEKAGLQAEGYYNDSSHQDITFMASWASESPGVVRMDKNNVLPVRLGTANVYAEYSGIRSLPVDVEVVLEKNWLVKLILKIIFLLVLLMLAAYSFLYILVEKAKERILALYADPRDFIIALYRNLVRISAILGVHYKFYMPPLFFAGLVDEKYVIRGGLFFKFTQQYEEAKYSSHVFSPEVSAAALGIYNQILEAIFVQQNKRARVYTYLMALINRVPLRVNKTKQS